MCIEYKEGEVKIGRFIYSLNDENKTAAIIGGSLKRWRRFKPHKYVKVKGEEYVINAVFFCRFNNFKCLKHLVLPDHIHYTDEYCFKQRGSLRTIYLGKGIEYVEYWGVNTFTGKTTILVDTENPYLKIENGLILTKDGRKVLMPYHRQKHYIVPEGVTTLGAYSIWGLDFLESVHLPSTLKEIRDNGLAVNPRLKEVILPEGFERFVIQGLIECGNLEYLDLPSTIEYWEVKTFYGCNNLKKMIVRTPYVLELGESSHNKSAVEGIPPCCCLYVPLGLLDAYRSHKYWGCFSQITSIELLEN